VSVRALYVFKPLEEVTVKEGTEVDVYSKADG
jgi:predicted DNA-binding antitoxin AbrB/MazE fold protein